jgi:hypothetical protein
LGKNHVDDRRVLDRALYAHGPFVRRPYRWAPRYVWEAGLGDFGIAAETEVILTFLLQLLVERGILAKLAFKGGTCLRKMTLGRPIKGSDRGFCTRRAV